MTILPREQVIQRHDATVSAPGVVLWASTTNLATREVNNTNLVVEGEVEDAQMAPPEFFWDVVVGPGDDIAFGEGEFGVGEFDAPETMDPDGIYQNHTYDGQDFGEGPFGGIELDWYVPHGPIYWGNGDNGENGVYP